MATPTRKELLQCMTKEHARKLTDEVRIYMQDIDKLVGKGQQAVLDLFEARAYKLLGYHNWSDYCRQEWGVSSTHGYRIIEAHRARKLLEAAGVDEDGMPETTKQAAELSNISGDPQEAAEVWSEAKKESGKEQPSVSDIKKTVAKKRSECDEEPDFEPDSKPTPDGVAIPDDGPIKALIGMLKKVETACIKLCSSDLGTFVHFPTIQADLANLKRNIKGGKPYAVCVYCKGQGCRTCKDKGWVNKDTFQVSAEELKE